MANDVILSSSLGAPVTSYAQDKCVHLLWRVPEWSHRVLKEQIELSALLIVCNDNQPFFNNVRIFCLVWFDHC